MSESFSQKLLDFVIRYVRLGYIRLDYVGYLLFTAFVIQCMPIKKLNLPKPTKNRTSIFSQLFSRHPYTSNAYAFIRNIKRQAHVLIHTKRPLWRRKRGRVLVRIKGFSGRRPLAVTAYATYPLTPSRRLLSP